MILAGLFLILAAGFGLKAMYFRIPLENNGGLFVYGTRFRSKSPPCPGTWLYRDLLALVYPLIGRPDSFVWVKVLQALLDSVVCLAVFLASIILYNDPAFALAAAFLFAFFSAVPHFLPFYANPEHLSTPFSAIGFCALIIAYAGPTETAVLQFLSEHPSALFLASGTMFGLASLSKLPSLTEVAAASTGVVFVMHDIPGRIWFPMGFISVWIAFFIYMSAIGRFSEITDLDKLFAYKKADYKLKRTDQLKVDTDNKAVSFFYDILTGTSPVWLLAMAFGALQLLDWSVLPNELHLRSGLVLLWFVGGLGSLVGQRVWTPGHWTPLFPALCVLAAGAMYAASVEASPGDLNYPALFMVISILTLGGFITIVSSSTYQWGIKKSSNYFRAIQEIAKFIKASTNEGDSVFVWSWQPQIYVLAGRRSAAPPLLYCQAGYLDTLYPDWRKTMAEGFLLNRPKMFVSYREVSYDLQTISAATGAEFKMLSLPEHIQRAHGQDVIAYSIISPQELPVPTCQKEARELVAKNIASRFESAKNNLPANPWRTYNALSSIIKLLPATEEKWAEGFMDSLQPSRRSCPAIEMIPAPAHELVVKDASQGGKYGVITENGAEFALNSSNNPKVEAERFAATVNKENHIIVLFGMALGYPVRALLDVMPEKTKLVVIERRISVHNASMQVFDFSKDIASGRLTILVSPSEESLKRAMSAEIRRRSGDIDIVIAATPATSRLDGAYYATIKKAIG